MGAVLLCQYGQYLKEKKGGRKKSACVTLLRLCRIGSNFLSYFHHAQGGLRGCEGCERAICALRMETASKRYRRARCC